ncbi:right-handed parallel beta-helix repeat-containing protein, partial [Candidatus Bipolaricaulota bacterium]|nr:right-handed parallel beta-helix repeat-containing protein [Candidatus Bipolaricaulota bacterium]
KTISGRYAVAFLTGNPTGCTISHCILDQPGKRGIVFWSGCGTGHTVEYTTISNVGPSADDDPGGECGIVIIGPGARTITIQHNTFTNMYRGVWVYNANSIVIDDNTFTSIKDQGHSGNEFSGAPAIDLHADEITGTANRIEVTNNTVSDCYWQGVMVCGSPYTYVYNNILHNCMYYGIDGTGDWDYAAIHVQDYPLHGDDKSDHCIIDDNTVYDCINGIQIWSDSCQVINNEIYDMGLTYDDEKIVGSRTYKNSAILVGSNFGSADDHDPTEVVIQNNNIHDNYWGLFYSADLANGVTAEKNYWGDASGPDGEGPGTGDAISSNVDYSPWWGANYVGVAHPWTWHTDDSIQYAIDVASSGDVINVAAGEYLDDENGDGDDLDTGEGGLVADIYKSDLTLQSTDGPEVTIIKSRGTEGDGAVRIRGADDGTPTTGVTVDGFTVYNTGTANSGAGIFIGGWFAGDMGRPANNNTVKNCIIGSATDQSLSPTNGVYLWGTTGNIIQSNIIYKARNEPDNFGCGVMLWGGMPDQHAPSPNNQILDNKIYDSDRWGLFIGAWPEQYFNDITVSGNTITGNGYGIGLYNILGSDTIHINCNNIYNNGYGAWSYGCDATVDAECNWWGAVNGPVSGDHVSDHVDYAPWLTAPAPGGPCNSDTPRGAKLIVVDNLQRLLPTGDKKTDHRIEEAIKHINKSLDPNLWETDSTLTKKGKKVFEEEKKAVKELGKIVKAEGDYAADAQAAIDTLVAADEALAQTAIDDAIAGGGDAKEIAKANKEMGKAQEEFNKGHFDKAIEHYKKAWEHACKVKKPKGVEIEPLAVPDEVTVVAYPNPIRDVNTATFQVMGTLAAQVEEIRVQIYDLSGRLVWEDATLGSELDWHTDSLSGDYLANGIYLYRVQVRIGGSWINQDIGKIAVLR